MVSSMMQRGNSSIRHLFLLSRPVPVYRISLPSSSSRHLSSDLPYTVIHTAERFFEGVHFYTHLPWWAVIVCCTVTLRSIITLPLAVYQNKILAKRELLAPTLKEYKEAVLHNVTIKCRRENVSHKIANRRVVKEQRKVERDLYRQEGCSPYKAGILPWVQLPLWITLSYALRDMTGVFPNKLPLNPEATLSFANEGALWFQNLTLPDPYCVLPIVLVCTNLLNIELHAIRRQAPSRVQRIMTYLFRFLTFGMGYFASQLPAGMSLYWSVSSSYGLTQNVLFKFPRVRRVLGFPKTPSESKQPFRDLLAIIQQKLEAFIKLQRKQ